MKTAFAQRIREITARVTIGTRVFNPDEIGTFKVVRGVSNAEEFKIGTSFSKMLELTLMDKYGTLNQIDYTGQYADVEIGVKIGNDFQYTNVGRFKLEEPEWKRKLSMTVTGFDDLQKSDWPYDSALQYPATLSQIFIDACNISGLEPDLTPFPNSTVQVLEKPIFYDMTCRQVLEQIAALAGGFCIFENGKVKIATISEDDISVTSENIKTMPRNEQPDVRITKLIIQQTGAEDHVTGTGDYPYYLMDNVFIQGDPERWAPAIFLQLNNRSFTAATVTFNGNPTGAVNKYTSVEYLDKIYQVLPGVRTLTYHGGLKEEWVSKPLSNTPSLTPGEKLVRSIRKNQTKLSVIEGEISSKVSESTFYGAVGDLNQRVQTAEEKITPEAITQTVEETTQELAKRSEVNQLAGEIELKASKADVDAAIDRINRANPNLVSNKKDNWDQGDIISGNPSNSTTRIRTVAFYPIRAGTVQVKINPLYQVKVVLYDQFYNFVSEKAFTSESSFTLSSDHYFKAVVRRTNSGAIVPDNIENTELKIEVGNEHTIWTPYYGDLTLDQQKEFFTLVIESSNGLAVDRPNWSTTLTARLFLFNDDVSIDYDDFMYTWYRQRAGEEPVLIGGGRTLNVTSSDIPKTTTYILEFQLSGEIFTLATLNNDDILTLDNDLIMATGIDTGFTRIFRTDKAIVRDVGDRVTAAEAAILLQSDQIESKVDVTTFNAETGDLRQQSTSQVIRIGAVENKINGATHSLTETGYEFKDSSGNIIFSISKGMANQENIPLEDNIGSGYPLIRRFHIDQSTASISQAVLKYDLRNFRTYSEGAAAGGGQTTSSGGGATVTSASGGGHTSGSGGGQSSSVDGSIGAQYTGLMINSVDYPGNHYHQTASTLGHSHWVYAHTHWVNHHTHSLTLPSHTHSVSDHTHPVKFGILEYTKTDNTCQVYIDGTFRTNITAANGTLDLTQWITTNGWHTIEIRTGSLKRFIGVLFLKTYIKR